MKRRSLTGITKTDFRKSNSLTTYGHLYSHIFHPYAALRFRCVRAEQKRSQLTIISTTETQSAKRNTSEALRESANDTEQYCEEYSTILKDQNALLYLSVLPLLKFVYFIEESSI